MNEKNEESRGKEGRLQEGQEREDGNGRTEEQESLKMKRVTLKGYA